ncbi:MAG: hypothetical protein QXD77_03530 [Candidatus Aenigmatarchaeota archaeon]
MDLNYVSPPICREWPVEVAFSSYSVSVVHYLPSAPTPPKPVAPSWAEGAENPCIVWPTYQGAVAYAVGVLESGAVTCLDDMVPMNFYEVTTSWWTDWSAAHPGELPALVYRALTYYGLSAWSDPVS